MGLFSLKPAREAARPGEVIVDLDRLIADPIAFQFGGKAHYINPITTAQWIRVTDDLTRLGAMNAQNEVDVPEAIDAFTRLVEGVCESIKKKEVLKMTAQQRGALLGLILKTVTGEAHAEAEKKKRQTELSSAHPSG